MILALARRVKPDLLVVDNVPAGLNGELLPTLRHLRESGESGRLVLGLRDVVDGARRVRSTWARDGHFDLLDDVYDLVVVYGDPSVYDVVERYGFSDRAAAKTRYVGYLPRDAEAQPQERNGRLRLLATAGGGGDGFDLLMTVLEARRRCPRELDLDCQIVTGPFMPVGDSERLRRASEGLEGVRVVDFHPDLTSVMASADVVVSMAGYNSICEILSLGRRAVVVPRVRPRREQLIRASALASRGLVRMIRPESLTPQTLAAEVTAVLRDPPARALPRFDGLSALARELERLLGRERPLAAAGA
jgi:predicted glycosyltransferase